MGKLPDWFHGVLSDSLPPINQGHDEIAEGVIGLLGLIEKGQIIDARRLAEGVRVQLAVSSYSRTPGEKGCSQLKTLLDEGESKTEYPEIYFEIRKASGL